MSFWNKAKDAYITGGISMLDNDRERSQLQGSGGGGRYNFEGYQEQTRSQIDLGIEYIQKQLEAKIRAKAADVGVKLNDQQIQELRNQLFNPDVEGAKYSLAERPNQNVILQGLDERVGTNLVRLAGEQSEKDIQKKIDEVEAGPEITDQHKTDASRIISEIYGRDATQDEVNFFANEMANGESSYELASFLKTTPEYQEKVSATETAKYKTEAADARSSLSQELVKGQQESFDRTKQSILGAYQSMGRANSSGLDAALANSAKDLESQRQNYLAGLSYDDSVRAAGYNREDFLNRSNLGYQQQLRQSEDDYQSNLAKSLYSTQTGLEGPLRTGSATTGLATDLLSRNRQLEDYRIQSNDWLQAMNEQKKAQKRSDLYGLYGSLFGAGGSAMSGWLAGKAGR